MDIFCYFSGSEPLAAFVLNGTMLHYNNKFVIQTRTMPNLAYSLVARFSKEVVHHEAITEDLDTAVTVIFAHSSTLPCGVRVFMDLTGFTSGWRASGRSQSGQLAL